MGTKKSFAKLIFLSSLAVLFFHSNPKVFSPADAGAIDLPARVSQHATDFSGAQRKPAVEPRVYIESAMSKTGFVYYDYADQPAPPVPQRPPLRR